MVKLLLGILLMLFSTADVSLAQEVAAAAASEPCTGLLCHVMGNFPEINAWLIAIFTFLGIVLRASAEFIGFASTHLKKSDAGWSKKLGDIAAYCASIVGWFGGGTPKVVLNAKVEKAVAKLAEKPVASDPEPKP